MTRGILPEEHEFEVTWVTTVVSRSYEGAAELARKKMIDPGITSVWLKVSRNDGPAVPRLLHVQDPDDSGGFRTDGAAG